MEGDADVPEILDTENSGEDVLCLLVEDENLPDGRAGQRRAGDSRGLGGRLLWIGGGMGGAVEVEEGEEGVCLCLLQRRRRRLAGGQCVPNFWRRTLTCLEE